MTYKRSISDFVEHLPELMPNRKMSTFTAFYRPTDINPEQKSSEEVMDSDIDHKLQQRDVKNEMQFRIDELEALLDIETKDKKQKERQLSEQMGVIQQLRKWRDNSVELNEYQTLSKEFEKVSEKCRQSRKTIESFNKRLSSEANENELLHKQIASKDTENLKLKNSLGQCLHKIEDLKNQMSGLDALNQRLDGLQNELERERVENLRLNELLNAFREEHFRHNESDISVEGLNQSIHKMLDAIDSTVGESLDLVLEMKLSDLEKEKELIETQLMNEKQRVIEFEELLDKETKDKEQKDKQLSEQIAVIQQMRQRLDNSVQLIKYQDLSQELEKVSEECRESQKTIESLNEKLNSSESELLIERQKVNEFETLLQNESKEKKQMESQLSQQLRHLQENTVGLNKYQDLSKELDKVSEECRESKETIESLNETLNSLQRQQKDEKNEMQFRIDELNILLDIETKDKEQKEKQLSEQMAAIQELRQQLDNSVELIEYQTLSKELEKVSEECRESQIIKESLNEGMNSLQTQLSNKNQRVFELEALLDNQTKDKEKIERLMSEQTAVIQELRQQLDNSVGINEYQSLSQELENMSEECRESRKSIQSLNEKLSSSESELLIERQKVNEFEALLDNETKEKQRIESQLYEELRQLHENSVGLIEYQTLSKELEKVSEECRESQETRVSLNEEMNSLQIQLSNKNQRVFEFEALIDKQTKEREQMETKLSEQMAVTQELKQLLDNSVAIKEYQFLSQELEKVSEECRESQITIESLNEKLSSSESQLLNERQKVIEFETLLNNETKEKERIEHQFSEQLKQLQENSVELIEYQTLNQELEKISEKCLELEKAIESLNEKLSSSESQLLNERQKFNELEVLLENEVKKKEKIEKQSSEQLRQLKDNSVGLNEYQALSQKLEKVSEEWSESQKTIELLNERLSSTETQLLNEKQNVLKASEELQQMHEVVDKRFNNFKEKFALLNQSLIDEQNKSNRLEIELKNQQNFENQRMFQTMKGYEKVISELKTKLNTEEMSFEMERKIKERYAKENELYVRQINALENECKRLKDLLDRSTIDYNGSAYFSIPSHFEANPQSNQTNRSVNSISISNCSNISFNANGSRKPPNGTWSRLAMADEEGQFMDPNHLNNLKRGECLLEDSPEDPDRLSILQRRNTMVLPHLRTSYGVELAFMKENVDPEHIRQGSVPNIKILKQIQNLQKNQTFQ